MNVLEFTLGEKKKGAYDEDWKTKHSQLRKIGAKTKTTYNKTQYPLNL